MAQKPRVQAPKQRSAASSGNGGRTRQVVAAVGGLVAALVLGGVLFFALGQASSGPDVELVRADLDAAGCTLKAAKAFRVFLVSSSCLSSV